MSGQLPQGDIHFFFSRGRHVIKLVSFHMTPSHVKKFKGTRKNIAHYIREIGKISSAPNQSLIRINQLSV